MVDVINAIVAQRILVRMFTQTSRKRKGEAT
jgi:hypothetical protein